MDNNYNPNPKKMFSTLPEACKKCQGKHSSVNFRVRFKFVHAEYGTVPFCCFNDGDCPYLTTSK